MRSYGLEISIAGALLLGTAAVANAQLANKVGVVVNGLRNDSGVVRCGLYASPAGFRQPGQEFRGAVGKINGQQATCMFSNLPAGTYAVAVFHAEKGEAQIKTGMFGKPEQGYGFSRNPSSGMGPPDFTAAAFTYDGGTQTLPVTLHY
jgi:uncharacterized protein (DUF2141 family)